MPDLLHVLGMICHVASLFFQQSNNRFLLRHARQGWYNFRRNGWYNLRQNIQNAAANVWLAAVPPCVGFEGWLFGGMDVHPLL
jgi:hypothetical protein